MPGGKAASVDGRARQGHALSDEPLSLGSDASGSFAENEALRSGAPQLPASATAADAEVACRTMEAAQLRTVTQNDQLYLFAERLSKLLVNPEKLPKAGSSRTAVLKYLEHYLGDCPKPKEGERWEESLANVFEWVTGETIQAADVQECFLDPHNDLNPVKLKGYGVHYDCWSFPLRQAAARAAQQQAKQAIEAAKPDDQLASDERRQQLQQHASSNPSLTSEEILRHRLLLHLATSKAQDGGVQAVSLNELVERFAKGCKDVSLLKIQQKIQSNLQLLVTSSYVEPRLEACKARKSQEFIVTDEGLMAASNTKEKLLAYARADRSEADVHRGLCMLNRDCEWYQNKKWYKGTVADFDEWQHLVNYEDGDQVWHDLDEDLQNGCLRWTLSEGTGEICKASTSVRKGKVHQVRKKTHKTVANDRLQRAAAPVDEKQWALLSPGLPDCQLPVYTDDFDVQDCDMQASLPFTEQRANCASSLPERQMFQAPTQARAEVKASKKVVQLECQSGKRAERFRSGKTAAKCTSKPRSRVQLMPGPEATGQRDASADQQTQRLCPAASLNHILGCNAEQSKHSFTVLHQHQPAGTEALVAPAGETDALSDGRLGSNDAPVDSLQPAVLAQASQTGHPDGGKKRRQARELELPCNEHTAQRQRIQFQGAQEHLAVACLADCVQEGLAGGKENTYQESEENPGAEQSNAVVERGPGCEGGPEVDDVPASPQQLAAAEVETLHMPAAPTVTCQEPEGSAGNGGQQSLGFLPSNERVASDLQCRLGLQAEAAQMPHHHVHDHAHMGDVAAIHAEGNISSINPLADAIDKHGLAPIKAAKGFADASETELSKANCYWLQREGPMAECKFKDKRENSVVCHTCQYQHIKWECQSGKGCKKSYCHRCISKQYNYLFESGHEADLRKFCKGWCPCCIGICNFIKCLRKPLKQLGQPPPEDAASQDQELVAAVHLAFQLLGPAMEIFRENKIEAARQGVQLEDVPCVPVGINERGKKAPRSERILCNRCATTVVNAHYHCSCGADFCSTCVLEQVGSQQGLVACFRCGQETQLQQLFSKDMLQSWAASEQRLSQMFEEGPLRHWLHKATIPLYEPSKRQWVVDGQPVSAYLQRLSAKQQQGQSVQHKIGKRQQQQQQQQQQLPPAQAATGQMCALSGETEAAGGGCDEGPHGNCARVDDRAAPSSFGAAAPHHAAVCAVSANLLSAGDSASANVKCPANKEPVAGQLHEAPDNPAVELKRTRRPTSKGMALKEQSHHRKQNIKAGPGSSLLGLTQVEQDKSSARQPYSFASHTEAQGRQCSFLSRHEFSRPCASDTQMTEWWEMERSWVSDEDLRMVAQRPDGSQNVIWTPHVSMFYKESENRARAMRLFTQRWQLGEPIVVRGFQGRLDWSPDTMCRMTREIAWLQGLLRRRASTGEKVIHLNVLDCKDFSPSLMKCHDFFNKLYAACDGATVDSKGNELPMYKLKDWPPEAGFAEKMARHNDDFVDMLISCLGIYTHPTSIRTGLLNLANHLPWYAKLPDLGPKGYIAYGREKEHEGEGDSVTKLHEDLSEAVNIMLHVQLPPGMDPPPPRCGPDAPWDVEHYGYAGAVWDIFRSQDREKLKTFLIQCVTGQHPDLPPFVHQGKLLTEADIQHPVHSQCFMLTEAHRQKLREEYGVHPWHIEQYNCEGVFVPAGSPHQVRNLRSSIKVALDFVTPESLGECLRLRQEFRELVLSDRNKEDDPGCYHYADRLQVRNMVLGGLQWALETIERHENLVRTTIEGHPIMT